jgi:hypothetical protein
MTVRTRLPATLSPQTVEHAKLTGQSYVPSTGSVYFTGDADAAAAQANAAAASAANAAASALTAQGSRDLAFIDAGNAAISASQAATSANNALTQANNAAATALNVGAQVTLASQWASHPQNTAVPGYPGQYSAYHWAMHAQAVAAGAAAAITFTPYGGIGATNVQMALQELDDEKATKASPTLTGTPLAPTPISSTNTDQIATTAFVQGLVTPKAPLASPTFTGKVTTAAPSTGGAGLNLPHGTSPTSPVNGDVWTTTADLFARINGTTVNFARATHTHLQSDVNNLPADLALKAPLASPALTGTPTAPTPTAGDNSTKVATTALNVVADPPVMQCRLEHITATSLNLKPYGGNRITIDGVTRELPAVGVGLGSTGLSTLTIYYIYAYWTGSAVALEASTTTPGGGAIPFKGSDSTRTLVGKIFTAGTAPNIFFDEFSFRYVLSYWNRRAKIVRQQDFNLSVSAVSMTSYTSLYVLSWADQPGVDLQIGGHVTSNTAAVTIYMDMNWGANQSNANLVYAEFAGGVTYSLASMRRSWNPPLEGSAYTAYHWNFRAAVTAGITTFTNCYMIAVVWG